MRNPYDQMEAIAQVGFQTVKLLNSEEARILPILERLCREVGEGHRVMAQTALGEVIRPTGDAGRTALDAAYASINSKRLDFAIIDRFGHLKIAIEYQGGGHYGTGAFLRDAVKREAVRRAGVAYIEVQKGDTPKLVKDRILAVLAPERAPGSPPPKPGGRS